MTTLVFFLAAIALVSGAILSTLQLCLRTVGRVPLEPMAERRSELALKRVRAILDDTDAHATAVALPRTLSNLVFVGLFIVWIALLGGQPEAARWSFDLVDLAIGIPAAALLLWIVSLIVPISVAEHAEARTVLAWSAPIRACHAALGPTLPLYRFVNEIVRRLSGTQEQTALQELEAELRSVVEESEREGTLDETERDMIEAVVQFRTTTTEQIMTPRTEVAAIEYTDDLTEVEELINERGHSRIPVYEEDLDHIRGILYAKDLLRWMVSDECKRGTPFELAPVLRPATFVPETKTVRELLTELLAAKVHLAVVIDEYGGTSGVVTIEDIVEEIFGEIKDEYEHEEEAEDEVVLDCEQRRATIDARTEIDLANDELEPVGIAFPEHDDYDTVGGFVTATLGRIPSAGETFTTDAMQVIVLEAEPTRVVRVEVRAADEARTADAPK